MNKSSILFKLLLLWLSCITSSCQSQENTTTPKYLRMVGDILTNEAQDNPDFKPCDDQTAVQYFAFGEKTFEGEKIAIETTFKAKYQIAKAAKESGLIRIRFLINCKGESGRFRVMGMDENYHEKQFDASITDQLVSITKGLKGWKTFPKYHRDYYQYLIFKMEDGRIVEMMP